MGQLLWSRSTAELHAPSRSDDVANTPKFIMHTNKFSPMSMGLWEREYSEQIVATRTVHSPYYSFVWGPLKHDQETVCRWMKCSDVVPEAGCHYLFETPTAIYIQMAGCMPVIQWKCHSFHVLITYFHHAMLEEVARSSWNNSSWEQATADRRALQLIPHRSGQTVLAIPPETPQLIWYFSTVWEAVLREPCLRNTFLVNSPCFISFHLAPWCFLIAYLKVKNQPKKEFITLSPFSSGSSSLRNSLFGYGIWQPANTLKHSKHSTNMYIWHTFP